MSHILEGLNQSPSSVKSVESEAYSSEPEGSQNGRPHFKSVPMHIVTIPVHRNIPELVRNSIGKKTLEHPITVYNIDGTKNKKGSITHYCWLWVLYNGQQKL